MMTYVRHVHFVKSHERAEKTLANFGSYNRVLVMAVANALGGYYLD